MRSASPRYRLWRVQAQRGEEANGAVHVAALPGDEVGLVRGWFGRYPRGQRRRRARRTSWSIVDRLIPGAPTDRRLRGRDGRVVRRCGRGGRRTDDRHAGQQRGQPAAKRGETNSRHDLPLSINAWLSPGKPTTTVTRTPACRHVNSRSPRIAAVHRRPAERHGGPNDVHGRSVAPCSRRYRTRAIVISASLAYGCVPSISESVGHDLQGDESATVCASGAGGCPCGGVDCRRRGGR